MVKIRIDDKELEVKEGTTVLQAALANQVEVPYFCYHPKLSIAGNCRMCLVKIEGSPKPVISCREKVRDGMVVDTKSKEVKAMQQGILEFILVNHPLDCPICDQAGECPLQDQYFKFSLSPSRMEDQKVHKPKVKPLGPNVMLDDERCIVCTRCVRFCDEIAGTHELCVTKRGGHSTLTTYPGKEMVNPYSMCTVDICPVGALTSRDFRFKKRVWFLSTTPSVCTGCATGCNIHMDWEDGVVYRYRPRDNEDVNECWMCDEGRMTYKHINQNRVLKPHVQERGTFEQVDWNEALSKTVAALMEAEKVVGVLSAQASCEENYVLYNFIQTCVENGLVGGSARVVDNPSQDNFLINADKNPNRNFLKHLKVKDISKVPTGAVFLVLGEVSEKLISQIVSAKPQKTIWITSNFIEPKNWAEIVLAKPTFAEQTGTYVNAKQRIQKANQAFAPKAHSMPVWDILSKIAEGLGKDQVWHSADRVFEKIKKVVPAFADLDYESIGSEGKQLDV